MGFLNQPPPSFHTWSGVSLEQRGRASHIKSLINSLKGAHLFFSLQSQHSVAHERLGNFVDILFILRLVDDDHIWRLTEAVDAFDGEGGHRLKGLAICHQGLILDQDVSVAATGKVSYN